MKFKYTSGYTTHRLMALFASAIVLVCSAGATFASTSTLLPQNRVTGIVTSSEDGVGLPGLSIIVKGTNTGTVTDFDGRYAIEVPGDAVLVFSFVGFETQEVAVGGRSVIDIGMQASMQSLDEVVVTALGIEREERSLGYSVGKVDGEEFTRVAQENFLNSMAGKISGVTINSTGGTGSTTSMIIRGATSLSNDNQPLFVVDGVPMQNRLNNVGGFGADNRVDYGNAVADLDPESIESVTVLKGPSAAALYGTRAGNGVVLITTKKAAGKGMKVSVSTNTVFDVPVKYLNTQKKFSTGFFSFRPENVGGGILPPISPSDQTGAGPEVNKGYWAVQWDAPLDANGVPIPTEVIGYPNNVRDFLNDYAFTTTNGVSISNSSDVVSYRLGVTNMKHSGLIPNSDLNKNNLSLSASSKVAKDLTVSTDINFVNSWADNRPANNRGTNPLQWAYSHPLNIDINKLRNYRLGDDIKRVGGNYENPWMLAYDVNNSFNRYQLFGNVVANWTISPKFDLMGRVVMNKSDEVRETKIGPGYTQEPNNGAYGIWTGNNLETNMDVLATYKNEWTDFSLTASAGGNIRYEKASNVSNSSKNGSGLVMPNLFTVSNISANALNYSSFRNQRAMNSVYGLVNLGWRETFYLDLTARNDWSSTLPSANRSYFYPSASLSVILNELVEMGNNVDLIKLRGGWAQVGNDTDPYNLEPVYGNAGQWGEAIRLTKPSNLFAPNLKPEVANSFEIGPEIRMFSNRLRFEGTYYRWDNRNQILSVPLAASTGFSNSIINAGLIQSKGVEFILGATPLKTADWTLDLDFNFTKNDTRILELAEEIEFIQFWDQARVRNIAYVKNDATGEDGRIGNLYSRKVRRVTDPNSPYYRYPILGSGLDAEWEGEEEYSKVGNYNPDFILGLQTTLSYKNFTLSMTFDWRSGGQYVSQTYRYMSESVHMQTWLDELVHPGALGGAPSDELRDWVIANADQLLYSDRLRPVGGPGPEYGGFPESFSGVTVYDGTFAPGVMGHYDDDGNFILESENLGNPGTIFLPYVVSYPWDIGQANMFDADYIKLREVSLNYRLPASVARKLRMENVNFSLYSRNIMLWAKDADTGVDPERAYQPEGGRLIQGVERYNVNPWVVPIGFKLGFTF